MSCEGCRSSTICKRFSSLMSSSVGHGGVVAPGVKWGLPPSGAAVSCRGVVHSIRSLQHV